MNDKTFYLAGPMSGYPGFNFAAFTEAAEALRADGYRIISPAEIDDEETREWAMASPDGDPSSHPSGKTWGDFMARDIKIVIDESKGVIVLPNWEESRGARIEVFTAVLCGHTIYRYVNKDSLYPVSPWAALRDAAGEMGCSL